jgi:hypothetical protein
LVDIETVWLYLDVMSSWVVKACKVVSGVRGEKRRSVERGAGERAREREGRREGWREGGDVERGAERARGREGGEREVY